YPVALRPEKLFPAELAHEVIQLVVGADDERAPFIENGQQIPHPTTLSALMRDLGRVQRIDARLGSRKGKPAKRVEPIVQVFRTGLDAAGLVHLQLVPGALRSGRHEANGMAALGGDAVRRAGER